MGLSASSSSRTVVVLLMSVLLTASLVTSRRIDCTRFVFAPRCRGVAAKRGENSVSLSDTRLSPLDDSYARSVLSSRQSEQDLQQDPSKLLRILYAFTRDAERSVPPTQKEKEALGQLF